MTAPAWVKWSIRHDYSACLCRLMSTNSLQTTLALINEHRYGDRDLDTSLCLPPPGGGSSVIYMGRVLLVIWMFSRMIQAFISSLIQQSSVKRCRSEDIPYNLRSASRARSLGWCDSSMARRCNPDRLDLVSFFFFRTSGLSAPSPKHQPAHRLSEIEVLARFFQRRGKRYLAAATR